MNTREKIIATLDGITDESILKELLEMIQLEVELSNKEVNISTPQKNAINRGLEDIENKRTISHETASNITSKWLQI